MITSKSHYEINWPLVLEGKRPARLEQVASWGASSEKSWEKRRESNSMRRKCVLTSWSEVRTIEAQSGISQESCHPLHQRALPCTVVDNKWLGVTHLLHIYIFCIYGRGWQDSWLLPDCAPMVRTSDHNVMTHLCLINSIPNFFFQISSSATCSSLL